MSRLATRRLIDASAVLDASDRALLNLWAHRGLDDHALARMTGMTEEAIGARRDRLVQRLSEELGLPPATVREALVEISDPGQDFADATGESGEQEGASPPTAITPASANGAVPEPVKPDSELAKTSPPPPLANSLRPTVRDPIGSTDPPRRRRGLPIALGLLAIVAIVVLVAVLSSGSASPGRVTHPRIPVAAKPTVPAASPTSPSPSPTVSRPPIAPLASLPGGVGHASGTILLLGTRKHLRLRLSIRHLPAAQVGHYEVWLYNSVLDSVALGRLRTGLKHLTLRLPRDAHHYRWIDISFQPAGYINHSGESILRAANPAAARKLPKKRSRRRRPLRRQLTGPRPAK
jgi:hypothetical protein